MRLIVYANGRRADYDEVTDFRMDWSELPHFHILVKDGLITIPKDEVTSFFIFPE